MSVCFSCHHHHWYFKRSLTLFIFFSFVCSDGYKPFSPEPVWQSLWFRSGEWGSPWLPHLPSSARKGPTVCGTDSHCWVYRTAPSWDFLPSPFSVFYSAFILFPFSTPPTYLSVYHKRRLFVYVPDRACLFIRYKCHVFCMEASGSCALNPPLEPTGGGPFGLNLLGWPGRVPVMWEVSKGKLLIPWML